jgi:protein subunit release factor A
MVTNWQADCKVEVIYEQTGTSQYPGGQQAGIQASSIRVTHEPTGIMAQYGEERSQHKNKQIAMEMIEWGLMKAKLL